MIIVEEIGSDAEMMAALGGLADGLGTLVEGGGLAPLDAARRLVEVVRRDEEASQAAVDLVLGRTAISSQLVDNLNASIHLRALLTDLFLVDELVS